MKNKINSMMVKLENNLYILRDQEKENSDIQGSHTFSFAFFQDFSGPGNLFFHFPGFQSVWEP